MNTEDALLFAILKQPDDPYLKLAYADWLEERGDPRHELLRLRCAIGRQQPADGNLGELKAREKALLKRYGDPLSGAGLIGDRFQRCELIKRGWVRRGLQLRGPLNASVEFNGRGFGYDTIYVNGTVRLRGFVQPHERDRWGLPHFYPPHEFSVMGSGRFFSARIDHYYLFGVTLIAFRFALQNVALYWEGDLSLLLPLGPALPLPLGRPSDAQE